MLAALRLADSKPRSTTYRLIPSGVFLPNSVGNGILSDCLLHALLIHRTIVDTVHAHHILRIHQATLQNAATSKKGNLLALLIAIAVVCSAKLAILLKSDGIPTMRVDPPDFYRFLFPVDSRANAPFRARGSSPSIHESE